MDITPIQRQIEPTDIPLERMAGNSQFTEEQKIAEATRQFEAILLRQILESTQKTVIPSTLTDDSTAADIYRGLITSQLADSISKSGSLGLAKSLQQQFTRQSHALAGDDRKTKALPTAPQLSDAARPHFPSTPHTQPVSRRNSPGAGTADLTHERPSQ